MVMRQWFKRAVGEMSRIRKAVTMSTFGGGTNRYTLDSSRVDYELARKLYDNTEDSYKLGAGFCKPLINVKAGFMGIPSFLSDDEEAQKTVNDFFSSQSSKMNRTHKKALSEGDCFVWITREESESILYPEASARLVYTIIPNEDVIGINRNPITKQVEQYVLKSTIEWFDNQGGKRKTTVSQWISADIRRIKIEGDPIPGMPMERTEVNPWGFIPIEHFRNEADETRLNGQSEFESIEPFIKAYHDVMLHALQGSKMHSTPRLKFRLKDVAAFLRNNFQVQDPAKFAQEGRTISLDGHEFLILTDDEDAQFIEVKSSIGDAAQLLKLLFYCIVSTSETPEFVFGVHTPGALASVKEQMPVFVRTINRKREGFAENWQRLARMVLAMTSQAEMKSFSTYATKLEWDEIDPRDEKELAETIETLVKGLDTAVRGEILSADSAAGFLKAYIPTMKEYDSDDPEEDTERKRIVRNKVERERLADGALGIDGLKRIDKELKADESR